MRPRRRTAATARPAGGRRAARTRGRPARARPSDITSGFFGAARRTRTSAPSLVTSSPSRSIASTAHSSPASGRRRRLAAAQTSHSSSPSRCGSARPRRVGSRGSAQDDGSRRSALPAPGEVAARLRASSASRRAANCADRELQPHRAVGDGDRQPGADDRDEDRHLRRQRRHVAAEHGRRDAGGGDLRPLAERERAEPQPAPRGACRSGGAPHAPAPVAAALREAPGHALGAARRAAGAHRRRARRRGRAPPRRRATASARRASPGARAAAAP